MATAIMCTLCDYEKLLGVKKSVENISGCSEKIMLENY